MQLRLSGLVPLVVLLFTVCTAQHATGQAAVEVVEWVADVQPAGVLEDAVPADVPDKAALLRGIARTAVIDDDAMGVFRESIEECSSSIDAAQLLLKEIDAKPKRFKTLDKSQLSSCRRLLEYYATYGERQLEEEAEELEELDELIIADGFQIDIGVAGPANQILLTYAKTMGGIARRACDLKEDQLARLDAIDEKWISEQSKKRKGKPGRGIVNGIARFLGGEVVQAGGQEQPQTIIRNVRPLVLDAVREVLEEEQVKAFEAELKAREDFEREAMAAVITASFDNRVFLSNEQRDGLQADVKEWLVGRNRIYWQFYFQNQSYLPELSNTILKKHLTDAQFKSLSGTHRYLYEADQMEWQMADGMVLMIEE